MKINRNEVAADGDMSVANYIDTNADFALCFSCHRKNKKPLMLLAQLINHWTKSTPYIA
jgi:hypothetical protein